MSDWAGIVWLVVLLLFNGFFVASEFAIVAAKRSQIEPLALEGRRAARVTLWAMEHVTLMLAMCQLGVTVCSLLILNVSEPAIHHLLEPVFELVGLPASLISTLAFVVTLLLVSFLHVVFGEMIPKNISFSMPDRSAMMLAPTLVALSKVFHPVVVTLNGAADLVLKLFGVTPKSEANSAFTLEQVQTIVAESTREGVLEDRTGALGNAFEFTEKTASDVAVPRATLVTLPATATPQQIEDAVKRYGYSRYLLSDEGGDLVGYVHLKDIIDLRPDEYDDPMPTKRIRSLTSIAENTELEDAMAVMQGSGAHVAKVFDRKGTVTGVLFWEDILEILIGEVDDATSRDER